MPLTVDSNGASAHDIKPPFIIHLKGKSSPNDKWQSFFQSLGGPPPLFIPPLLISPVQSNCTLLQGEIEDQTAFVQRWGGVVFTSQRAVEQVAKAFAELPASEHPRRSSLASHPLLTAFVVGPATGASVSALASQYALPWKIVGQETGNGAALAEYIKSYYSTSCTAPAGAQSSADSSIALSPPRAEKQYCTKPLLYLVGENHDASFAEHLQQSEPPISVTELVVYASCEDARFGSKLRHSVESFASLVRGGHGSITHLDVAADEETWSQATPVTVEGRSNTNSGLDADLWIVAWAPSGMSAMLKALGWLQTSDGHSPVYDPARRRDQARTSGVQIKCAAIGPKTAGVARDQYGFEFECVAEKPTVDALWGTIKERISKERKDHKNDGSP